MNEEVPNNPEKAHSLEAGSAGAAAPAHAEAAALARTAAGNPNEARIMQELDVYLGESGFTSHVEPSAEEKRTHDESQHRVRRKRKKSGSHSHAKSGLALRITAIVLIVALVVAAAAFALLKIGESRMKSVDYNEGAEITYNGATYTLNRDIVSFCFIGYDLTVSQRGKGKTGQADVIMVCALDTSTGKMKVINIPRDAMVDVDEMVGDDFLGVARLQACLAFAYGDGYEKSCLYTVRVAQRVLYNMPINYYLALNMQGVAPLNDAVGGITLTPLASFPSRNIIEGEETTLFGERAMDYVRSRDADLEASEHRQERQIQYVKAFASQALAQIVDNPSAAADLFNIASDYSMTNLGISEIGYIASIFAQHSIHDIEIVNLPGTTTQPDTYAEFNLDREGVYQIMLDTFYVKQDSGESR